MIKLIVVLIIMLLALWHMKGILEDREPDSRPNSDQLPTTQSVDEFKKNYEKTINDQMLIEQKQVRDQQIKEAMED